MKIIDLTHELTSQTPVYPGDPKVSIEAAGVISRDGFSDHKVSFGTHVGTHIDAASHMIEGGKMLKEYDVSRFIVPAVCIDLSGGISLDAIKSANILDSSAVLLFTGASDRYSEESYWHDYKVLRKDCCELLIEKKVAIVGVDTGSVDNQDDFPVHKALLSQDILILENLTNLRELAGKTFELIALPLKLEDDGAPARVVARL